MTPRKSQLQSELQQKRPFWDNAHELLIGLLRTAAVARREMDKGLEGSGLSGAQYNVLRILRGAGADGLPTLEVRNRLIDAAPGVTRLMDKLTAGGLISRTGAKADRRQVICRITPKGLALLERHDPLVHAAIVRVGERLSAEERRRCIALLDALRRDEAAVTP